MLKPAIFHPYAIQEIQTFSKEVRLQLGKAIFDLQNGQTLAMPLSRPMSEVSSGVHELRVKDRHGIYRVFYLAKLKDQVLVFHAFAKKTQTTPKHEIELGRKRLEEMLK